ncbi:MAG: GatB/YqeY domain-containing protein [Flavobacteriales bacterium]
MNLTEQINNDIKTAMKAREADKLSALRDIKSKLLLEATKGGSSELDEATGLKILNKLYKQRVEAAGIYKEQGREDLAKDELTQAEVIKAYLPEKMSPDKLKEAVQAIVTQTGASSMADMGKVMGMASKQLAGKADGKDISNIVKELLG